MFKNKKGTTIKEIFIVTLIGIMAFGVMLLFVNKIANDNGAVIDPRMNVSLQNLENYSASFKSNLDELATLSNNASEAQFGDFAYFGIRGMVAIMKAPFKLTGVVVSTVQTTANLLIGYVPIEMISTISIIALGILVFAAIKFLTSRGQEP